jgi:hypothetical protein
MHARNCKTARWLRAAAIATALVALSSAAVAQNATMFRNDGYVKVGSAPFSGSGQFKFAILNTSGTTTLWTGDGTAMNGSEPLAPVAIPVDGGVYTALIGDPNLGMVPVDSSLFASHEMLKLRTWFSDGTHGFELLQPDRELVNVTPVLLSTGSRAFSVYVNGITGNDTDSGLTPGKAKKTIQGAVGVLPPRLDCNVTVEIAAGDYREEVVIAGVTIVPGKTLEFVGDGSWTATSPGNPNVRMPGVDSEAPGAPKVRQYAFHARQCSGLKVRGIYFDRLAVSGVWFENGSYEVESCKASGCGGDGFLVSSNNFGTFKTSLAENNTGSGYMVSNNSRMIFTRCESRGNLHGAMFRNMGFGNFDKTGNYSSNRGDGLHAEHLSSMVFWNDYTGILTGNAGYGMSLTLQSYCENQTRNSYGGNTLGPIYTATGGMLTY